MEELKELQEQYLTGEKNTFLPADKLKELYQVAKERHLWHPEEYAVKNWIVRVQGFLINCATYGFTSNYSAIMEGTYRHDLFHQTFAEQLMDLLGDLAYRGGVYIRDHLPNGSAGGSDAGSFVGAFRESGNQIR